MSAQSIEKLRRDHEHMLDLVRRIKAQCTRRDVGGNCGDCRPGPRQVCHGNIDQMIRHFVEVTLKHNLLEALYMENLAPAAHRLAHNRAHLEIARRLQALRLVFSDDGNCVLAIEGMDLVEQALHAHFENFDRELEGYLIAAV